MSYEPVASARYSLVLNEPCTKENFMGFSKSLRRKFKDMNRPLGDVWKATC